MIVCHCTGIRSADIRSAIDWMRSSDPDTIITPGKIYRVLGKKAECGGCLPLFIETMSSCPSLGVPAELTNMRSQKAASKRRSK
ncbi:BFD-like [2Fe-2S] binding domain-containing protein [Roseivivax lentus]|uniref:BFD-like [2Fe-2S] binding domain-containing protein n=1 Tax=Roseivivax lentus TaxID=633194 RepID=A0A1N7M8W5_9RHOB|nr:(2Fe-2S)-binding protein [Roseivivax lentus]SIS82463.1 BFD-like [2Fe-2S] binding domain-containing protein [Roseivivax lentus]